MVERRQWQSLQIDGPDDSGIAWLSLNRPSRSNAFDSSLFSELPLALSSLDSSPHVRVIILQAVGKNFCSGIDLSLVSHHNLEDHHVGTSFPDHAALNERNLRFIKTLQASFSSLEDCRKPVVASIQGACVGAGIDLITACDLRYCSNDAYFSVKEVDLAIVADLGTLQRLPRIVGYGTAMELALTGRTFGASEAKSMGLVHDVFPAGNAMKEQITAVARNIAAKSPLTVVGIKKVMVKSWDLSVHDGLDYVATWNSSMLKSADLKEAVEAFMEKRKPVFSKL